MYLQSIFIIKRIFFFQKKRGLIICPLFLKDVINYEELYVDVENCVKENKFNLIEALAEKILNVIMLKYTVVESSVVRVRKPFAPIKGIFDNIEFEIVKKRNDYE